MKILFVIGTSGMGGAERVAFNLAKWFSSQNDCRASVMALNKAKKASYIIDGTDFVELEGGNHIIELRKFVKKEKPDVLITMSVPLCIYTVPALAGLGIKHIISERNSPAHFAGKRLTKFVSRLMMIFADGYVFQTVEAQRYYNGCISKKSVVIHNPVSNMPQTFHDFNIPDTKTIVSVGRLNAQKNQGLLIRAFANVYKEFPDYSLVIWGEGRERESLLQIAKECGVESNVHLPGTATNIFEKIKDASLFVMSSDYEGMPNALMEAMALGLPCILTDCPCGGPRELIDNGSNGLLVPVGDVCDMSMAIKSVIENNSLAKSLGEAASIIRKTHSLELIGRQWGLFIETITR